jgi:hypothetical protein
MQAAAVAELLMAVVLVQAAPASAGMDLFPRAQEETAQLTVAVVAVAQGVTCQPAEQAATAVLVWLSSATQLAR